MIKILNLLSLLGLADSLYLTYIKLTDPIGICAGVGSCDVVNTSEFSSFAGIPIALFGAAAYIAILIVLFSEPRSAWFSENGPLLIFGMSLFGFLYSLYLTYIELFVIFAICPFCVISAILMTLLFILSWIRLREHWSTN